MSTGANRLLSVAKRNSSNTARLNWILETTSGDAPGLSVSNAINNDDGTSSNSPNLLHIAWDGKVGIGANPPSDRLDVAGNLRVLTGSNPIRFTAAWSSFPDPVTNQAEISNDTGTYKTLMIVGNKSAGLGRRVSIWDRLEVNGRMSVSDRVSISGNTVIGGWFPFREFWLATDPKANLFVNGDIRFEGNLIGGGKGGYVMDQFVNKLGEALEEGDIVVISGNQASLYYGPNNNIPIPEVDTTQEAYDTRVCGIVCEVYGELTPEVSTEEGSEPIAFRPLTREEMSQQDRTIVQPDQIGWMVTLGTYAHCKVDADIVPVQIGDLLTTSPTKGHAQKVLDRPQAMGAIIGKALGALDKWKVKIPVLVMLQ